MIFQVTNIMFTSAKDRAFFLTVSQNGFFFSLPFHPAKWDCRNVHDNKRAWQGHPSSSICNKRTK